MAARIEDRAEARRAPLSVSHSRHQQTHTHTHHTTPHDGTREIVGASTQLCVFSLRPRPAPPSPPPLGASLRSLGDLVHTRLVDLDSPVRAAKCSWLLAVQRTGVRLLRLRMIPRGLHNLQGNIEADEGHEGPRGTRYEGSSRAVAVASTLQDEGRRLVRAGATALLVQQMADGGPGKVWLEWQLGS